MRLIIAGSRTLQITPERIGQLMAEFAIPRPSAILSGEVQGVDRAGENYGLLAGIPVEKYPAAWDDWRAAGATVKTDKRGRPYNIRAGHWRNRKMAMHAQALLLVWDGSSPGSRDMKAQAEHYGLTIYEKVMK